MPSRGLVVSVAPPDIPLNIPACRLAPVTMRSVTQLTSPCVGPELEP